VKKLAEKIKSFITSDAATVNQKSSSFDFIKSKKGIFKELVISKESNNILGVYCNALGEGMFLTAVEDIENDIVVFHPYDISGRLLSRSRVALTEIQMVCPFNKTYGGSSSFVKSTNRDGLLASSAIETSLKM
jgi:hypothetical protein